MWFYQMWKTPNLDPVQGNEVQIGKIHIWIANRVN